MPNMRLERSLINYLQKSAPWFNNWVKLFDQTDINALGSVPTETRLNVFWHYVPIKYITVNNDKDPVWMNENKIKN